MGPSYQLACMVVVNVRKPNLYITRSVGPGLCIQQHPRCYFTTDHMKPRLSFALHLNLGAHLQRVEDIYTLAVVDLIVHESHLCLFVFRQRGGGYPAGWTERSANKGTPREI